MKFIKQPNVVDSCHVKKYNEIVIIGCVQFSPAKQTLNEDRDRTLNYFNYGRRDRHVVF